MISSPSSGRAVWRRRFAANRDTIASLYDERFCRMFEFYLSSVELAFCYGSLTVFQIQLAHRQTAVPLTRDYITNHDGCLAHPARAGARAGPNLNVAPR